MTDFILFLGLFCCGLVIGASRLRLTRLTIGGIYREALQRRLLSRVEMAFGLIGVGLIVWGAWRQLSGL